MNTLVPYIWVAGGIHLVIAAANFVLPKKLDYQANLSKVSTIVRQVFWVHSVYIFFTLLAFGAMCFLFAPELAGDSSLGRFLSGFLALFWLLRIVVQLFYYDPELKRQNPVAHVAFSLAVGYLGVIFAIAVVRGVT